MEGVIQIVQALVLTLILSPQCDALSLKIPLNRRDVISNLGITSSFLAFPELASAKTASIASRLDSNDLLMPPTSRASELNGVDNVYYPEWMQGEWSVTQTLVNTSLPLGLKYIGGPAGSEEIALESMKEQQKQLNVPVDLRLRWVKTKFGVAEDRLFNTKQRLNSFAGRSVVSSVEYANVGGSNRQSVILLGGSEEDPLQTTVVRFKGPAAQKTFLISHGEEVDSSNDNRFYCYELTRSIFALTNQSTVPPVTTDTESIWSFERVNEDIVNAKLRIASYLNSQSDRLYFDAKNRAVSFADYTIQMLKMPLGT